MQVHPDGEMIDLADSPALPKSAATEENAAGEGAWEWAIRLLILLALAGILYAGVSGRVLQPLIRAAEAGRWSRLLARPGALWMLMGMIFLTFRTFLWLRYRPFPAATPDDAPPLSVIIPAYNEGAMVEKAIHSVAAAAYPRERLEILVIDDGSRDDTWHYIRRAARHHPGLVKTIRFPRNRGKRAALAAGFRRARGKVLVTLDSDSVIERGTLLALAGPFRNERVGAVAGKVDVFNRRAGVIPRMLQVRYILSFDMLRAVQSTYRTVYCCPGALTAYRAGVVRAVLSRWEKQTFLGVRCTYGEDRAMTNEILAAGFDTVYQKSAVVRTTVPSSYRQLCRMFLRWDRSYIREEIRFARIVWRRPLGSRLIAAADTLITNLRYPVRYGALILLAEMLLRDPTTIVRVLLAIGLMSAFQILFYLHSERSWNCLYGILYSYFAFFALFWIFPYAALTVRSRSWMTR